ncbi:hypothetical protein BCR32DRAFT_248020 [Anaeromyces robustus]|uniref:Uncharacterized protein n=1 Tax=Anaeromyces robustus TaxID=1754192 RepID=A0A1Y1WUU2_9FUNG|nr:hypothetical protein BCR32DRAFT_248020 [Anaeromyces robustus]|eukprot:ORX77321.1 hypothetical protein BCR32DRAFT_248020 [Anaeromyces robustus]
MYTKNIIVYIFMYITLYFPYINSYNISITSENIPPAYIFENKEDNYILKTKLENKSVDYEKHYYCKNDNCIEIELNDNAYFIEFPENNKIKRYILHSCIYDDKLNKVINCDRYKKIGRYDDSDYADLSCTNNSECFYNKCIDNYCVFNEDPSSTHCDYVHKGFAIFQYTFLHCGKTYHDICKYNNECSSYKCYDNKCSYNYYSPSESTSLKKKIETFFFFIIIIALIFICSCVYVFRIEHKDKLKRKKQQFNKLENNTSNEL